MGLITINDGDTPDGSDLNTVASQGIIPLSSAQMLGWSSPHAGATVWNTEVHARYVYDGSNWFLDGGRRFGFKMLAANTFVTNTDHTVTFSTIVQDTDGFRTSSSLYTIPSFAAGTYGMTLHAVAANGLGFGGSGGWVRIVLNGGAESWSMPVGTVYDGTTNVPMQRWVDTVHAPLAGGDTLQFVIAHTCVVDQTFNAEAMVYRTGP